MLSFQGLENLFELNPEGKAPVVTVFAQHVTTRLEYTCKFIFHHVLKCRFRILYDITEFNKVHGVTINYSVLPVVSTLTILPSGILEEKTVPAKVPDPYFIADKLCFYPTASGYHFDIFSAVFFMISRTEEWASAERDHHGRFEAAQSILSKHQTLTKPVVDIWIMEFGKMLSEKGLGLSQGKFRVLSSIDIDNLFAFSGKGFFRSFGATIRDLLKFDFINIRDRLLVLAGKEKDPFDIYSEISDFCFDKKIPLFYFFLFRTGTEYDRTVDPSSAAFKDVFEVLRECQAVIGLHPSYDSSKDKKVMTDEVTRFSKAAEKKVEFSRQHFLRFDIRTTPGILEEQGVRADFSMGFASESGFRAGTSFPFYYFDFEKNQPGSLLFIPFCGMDGVYSVYKKVAPEIALQELVALADEVRAVNGNFMTVFHERSFYDHLYPGFGNLYKNLHNRIST
jgi:hypothetical protein